MLKTTSAILVGGIRCAANNTICARHHPTIEPLERRIIRTSRLFSSLVIYRSSTRPAIVPSCPLTGWERPSTNLVALHRRPPCGFGAPLSRILETPSTCVPDREPPNGGGLMLSKNLFTIDQDKRRARTLSCTLSGSDLSSIVLRWRVRSEPRQWSLSAKPEYPLAETYFRQIGFETYVIDSTLRAGSRPPAM